MQSVDVQLIKIGLNSVFVEQRLQYESAPRLLYNSQLTMYVRGMNSSLTLVSCSSQPLIIVANKCDVKKITELSEENQVGGAS